MGTYEDLDIFKLSYKMAMEIFGITSQLNRSSRSVCANIVEAYRKKHYPKHFVSKLSDADGECSETLVWIKMCRDMDYLPNLKSLELEEAYHRIGQMIGQMMKHPEKFHRD
jgi:four helix bundle protein